LKGLRLKDYLPARLSAYVIRVGSLKPAAALLAAILRRTPYFLFLFLFFLVGSLMALASESLMENDSIAGVI
jgi:hypothetical protein